MCTGDPAEVAALLELAASEPDVIDQLRGCVDRLDEAQRAKQTLAQLQPEALKAGLLARHGQEPRR